MPNPDAMSKPVTHGELREILAEDRTLIVREFARIVTETVKSSEASMRSFVTETVAHEVAHAVRSSEESLRSYMGALLDKASANDEQLDAKYSDLPRRVTRLEAAMFPPKRQRRR